MSLGGFDRFSRPLLDEVYSKLPTQKSKLSTEFDKIMVPGEAPACGLAEQWAYVQQRLSVLSENVAMQDLTLGPAGGSGVTRPPTASVPSMSNSLEVEVLYPA